MFLAGSNNCYDVIQGGRNGRRSRDWQIMDYYNRKGKTSEKPDIILKKLDAEIRRYIKKHRGEDGVKPSHIREHFGYYSALAVRGGRCLDTSWDEYRGQFSNGIRKALTIEELDARGINLYFLSYSYGDSPDGKPPEAIIKTERDYFTELKKWRAWQAISGKSFSLSFKPLSTDTVLYRLHHNIN